MRQKPVSSPTERAPRKPAAPFRCRLVIMAKLPVAGRVKTRLAREVGVAEALRFYRAASRAVIRRLGRQPFWETITRRRAGYRRRQPRLARGASRSRPQGGGDLGRRMQRPMRTLPPGPVCVIGTDIPAIEAAACAPGLPAARPPRDACSARPRMAASGWSGMRRRPRVIDPYAGVRWSHPETLADALANLRGAGAGFTDQPRRRRRAQPICAVTGAEPDAASRPSAPAARACLWPARIQPWSMRPHTGLTP